MAFILSFSPPRNVYEKISAAVIAFSHSQHILFLPPENQINLCLNFRNIRGQHKLFSKTTFFVTTLRLIYNIVNKEFTAAISIVFHNSLPPSNLTAVKIVVMFNFIFHFFPPRFFENIPQHHFLHS